MQIEGNLKASETEINVKHIFLEAITCLMHDSSAEVLNIYISDESEECAVCVNNGN